MQTQDKRTDFVITVNNVKKVLFSAERNNDGTVMLYQKPGMAHELSKDPVMQDVFSLHPSPKIKEFSLFHHKRKIRNFLNAEKTDLESSIAPKSYKSRKQFTHLFSALRADMTNPFYNLKSTKHFCVDLGSYQLAKETLFFSVFV